MKITNETKTQNIPIFLVDMFLNKGILIVSNRISSDLHKYSKINLKILLLIQKGQFPKKINFHRYRGENLGSYELSNSPHDTRDNFSTPRILVSVEKHNCTTIDFFIRRRRARPNENYMSHTKNKTTH